VDTRHCGMGTRRLRQRPAGQPAAEPSTAASMSGRERDRKVRHRPAPPWPDRQIRSQPSPVPAHPSAPLASPLVQVNGHIADPTRASVPARHVRHGGNVVAVSSHRRQTQRLATRHCQAALGALSISSRAWCSSQWGIRQRALPRSGSILRRLSLSPAIGGPGCPASHCLFPAFVAVASRCCVVDRSSSSSALLSGLANR
jgi:hypothetical protein